MDYRRFVELREPLWRDLEERLARARKKSPSHEELEAAALAYRQVLHDHALAASRFAGTAGARRLRRLVFEATRYLSRPSRRWLPDPRRFFGRTLPRAFALHLPFLGAAVALFFGAALGGLLLAVSHPGLATSLLAPEALDDLAQGRLWTESLTTTVPPSVSSSRIATNNLSVALTAWAGGALAGFLSLWIVVLNGIHLGSVVGVTLHYSMAGELLEFVSAHGFLEITLILISAAGGMRLGWYLVAAVDEPRATVLARVGRESLSLLLGCLPWIVLLAAVEVLISPAPEIPAAAKVVLGLGLEAGFLSLVLRRRLVLSPAGEGRS
jgi:uncharacterized membrane protein SpoIIM required for sporulation